MDSSQRLDDWCSRLTMSNPELSLSALQQDPSNIHWRRVGIGIGILRHRWDIAWHHKNHCSSRYPLWGSYPRKLPSWSRYPHRMSVWICYPARNWYIVFLRHRHPVSIWRQGSCSSCTLAIHNRHQYRDWLQHPFPSSHHLSREHHSHRCPELSPNRKLAREDASWLDSQD